MIAKAESHTKLLAFNQTQYQRVLHLDSDSTILQCMDDLYSMPPAAVAMPRAYWLGFETRNLSSQVLLIQPSQYQFTRVMEAVEAVGNNEHDRDILNKLYRDSAVVIPHNPYNLLTREFRRDTHQNYVGDEKQIWDSDNIFNEAKYLHFSDWPLPKVSIPTEPASHPYVLTCV